MSMKTMKWIAGLSAFLALALLGACVHPGPARPKAPPPRGAAVRTASPDIDDSNCAFLLRGVPLPEPTVMQSFAVHPGRKAIYTIQLVGGGRILAGEAEAASSKLRADRGDLRIAKLDMEGRLLGSMYALGFGHGVQMGVEAAGDGDYLWTEIDASSDGQNGWGTRIARFRFVDGAILDGKAATALDAHGAATALDAGRAGLRVFAPVPGADRTTVNVDSGHGRLVMRYRQNGFFRYAVYPLEAASRGEFKALADLPQPAVLGTFQGYALCGDSLYFLDGDTKTAAVGAAPGGDVYLSRVELSSPGALARRRVTAAPDLSFREPEGLSVYEGESGPELVLGFASFASAQTTAKSANFLRCGLF
jgi:hypothetical protein